MSDGTVAPKKRFKKPFQQISFLFAKIHVSNLVIT